jgi:hypothetical protein
MQTSTCLGDLESDGIVPYFQRPQLYHRSCLPWLSDGFPNPALSILFPTLASPLHICDKNRMR